MRLLKNKVLMFNLTAGIFHVLSASGYITFLSKYMEVQFNISSARSSVITGPAAILGMVAGFLLSGYFITKYKPRPRKLFFWNVVIGFISMTAQFSYMHLHCDGEVATPFVHNATTSCNSDCFCDNIPFTPVCEVDSSQTYFSPCHAGCKAYDDIRKEYINCTCSHELHKDTPWSTMNIPIRTETQEAINGLENILGIAQTNNESTTVQYDYDSSYYDLLDSQEELLDSKNGTKRKRDTSNVIDTVKVVAGVCALNCVSAYTAFTIISMTSHLMSSTGRIGNLLLGFR